jgi:Domain of unknown function (DUF4157)
MGGSFAGHRSRERQQARGKASRTTSPRTLQTAQDWALQLQRTAGNQAVARLLQGGHLPSTMAASDRPSGEPLDPATRVLMEARLGHDFSSVRVHTDQTAARSARQVDARAFTVGDDVVLGAGAPPLQTKQGQRLLAHELAHVVQQRRGGSSPRLDPEAAHERDADTVASAIALGHTPPPISQGTAVAIARQPIEIPKVSEKTGITVEPGPLRPGVLGLQFPLPTSITLLKPPGYGRGSWLTAPSFMLRLDPRGLVAGLLDQVSLGGFPLTNPTLVYDVGTDSITAVGTVSIPTKYPGWDSPTNIEVRIRSSGLGQFNIQGTTGPLVAGLTLDISYNSAPLERVLKAATAGNLAVAAAGLGEVEREARFRIAGSAGVGWPAHKLPLTYVGGVGSVGPSGASGAAGAVGVIGLPKGTFHPELAVPAAGLAGGGTLIRRTGATAGYGFGGITGTPSIQKLLSGDLTGGFVPFAYAQLMATHRTSDGHRFSIKISYQYQIGSTGEGETPVEQFRSGVDARRQAERYAARAEGDPKRAHIDPAVLSHWTELQSGPAGSTGGGLVVTGSFDLLGGR